MLEKDPAQTALDSSSFIALKSSNTARLAALQHVLASLGMNVSPRATPDLTPCCLLSKKQVFFTCFSVSISLPGSLFAHLLCLFVCFVCMPRGICLCVCASISLHHSVTLFMFVYLYMYMDVCVCVSLSLSLSLSLPPSFYISTVETDLTVTSSIRPPAFTVNCL